MWRKHRVAQQLYKPVIGVFLLTLSFTTLSLFIPTHKVSAATSNFSPTQQATAWEAGMVLGNCSNSMGWDRKQTGEDINKGGIFNKFKDIGSTKIPGYLVNSSTGTIDCSNKDEILKAFNSVNLNPLDFLKKAGIYKLNADNTAYDVQLSNDPDRAQALRNEMAKEFGFSYAGSMPHDLQYAALLAAFNIKCMGTPDNGANPVDIVDSTGKVTPMHYVLKGGAGDVVEVGYSLDGDGGGDQKMSCPTIVQQMNKYSGAYAATVTANAADKNPGNDTENSGGQTGLGDNKPTCETSGNPLTWILCPLFNGVADFSDWMFRNMVEPLLRVSPVSTNPSQGSFQVWSSFRLYGNIILIISMLVIVFSQAIGGGVVDAYTAKKVMPRIIVAAILVNLSIYIVAFLVDITNILGGGIGQLMTAPFGAANQFNFSPNALQSITIGGGTILGFLTAVIFSSGAVVTAGVSFLAVFVLLPATLGLIGAFVTLVLRQGLILILIMVSPVAFALYCLPNTETYFKKWWELLIKTLLVYPIIVVIFAGADILAVTVQQANGFGDKPLLVSAPANVLSGIIAFAAMFMPLALIPWAFKLAGGAIGALSGTIANFNKKGAEFVKGNINDPNSRRNKARSRFGQELGRRTADYVHLAEGRKNANSFGGARRDRLARGVGRGLSRFTNADLLMARANKREAEESEEMSATSLDDYRYAAGGFQASRDYNITDSRGNVLSIKKGGYYNSKGAEISETLFKNAKRWQGRTMSEVGTQMEYTARKAKTDLHHAALRIALSENARAGGWGQDGLSATQAQAMYPHKPTGGHQWFSKAEMQPDGSVKWHDVSEDSEQGNAGFDDMSSEHAKMMLAHQLGGIQDGTWRVYEDRQNKLEQKLAAGAYADTVDSKGAKVTAAQQRQHDVDRLATTYELIDAATFEQQLMPSVEEAGGESRVSASGASAASQPIIRRMKQGRKFDFAQTDTSDGARQLVVKGDPSRTVIGHSYTTGGDVNRSAIPRNT